MLLIISNGVDFWLPDLQGTFSSDTYYPDSVCGLASQMGRGGILIRFVFAATGKKSIYLVHVC